MIPPTSVQFYLSGITALNVPCPDGTDGDWHFHSVFNPSDPRLEFAGKGRGVLVNTNPFLGPKGIHECSSVLRDRGVTVEGQVFAASHARAVVDKVVHLVLDGHSSEWIAKFLVAQDHFPSHQIRFLDRMINHCSAEMPGYQGLLDWRKQTNHWSPLLQAVEPHRSGNFSHVGVVQSDEGEIHRYRYLDTDCHLNIDNMGRFYLLDKGSYVPVTQEEAVNYVFMSAEV